MTKKLQKHPICKLSEKFFSGWLTSIWIVALVAGVLGLSCRRNVIDGRSEETGANSSPAVITGHILNSQVYPKTTEIYIETPFYNRVADKVISAIFEDRFALAIVPYGPRLVSMQPFIDHLMVRPGDSIHVELDFSNLGRVVYSGDNAENNQKLNEFFMKYYNSNDWPVFGQSAAVSFVDECKEKLQSHLATLDRFEAEMHPSKELKEVCLKEIEAAYFSALIQGLLLNKSVKGAAVSEHFRITDSEYLFDAEYLSSNLFALSSNISLWLLDNLDKGEIQRMNKEQARLIDFFNKTTKDEMLRQMLICNFYNQLLEANKVEMFEELFAVFNKNVTYPLLKLQTRDRYLQKKAYQQNPRVLSNAILNADRTKEGQSALPKENEGLRLLRQLIAKEKGHIVYIAIGASWCPGSLQELPFQQKLASDFLDKPLRVVNFWIEDNHNQDRTDHGIENYYLTDSQLTGLDPIFHTGRGIPFYILIDKEGVIVDYGEHLRPSFPSTQKKLKELVN